MHARCSALSHKPSTGDAGDLAAQLQARVADVADEKNVEAALDRALAVLHHIAAFQVIEIAMLWSAVPPTLVMPGTSISVRVFDVVEYPAPHAVVRPPFLLARHALIQSFMFPPPQNLVIAARSGCGKTPVAAAAAPRCMADALGSRVCRQ
jgi:hypothetical protein